MPSKYARAQVRMMELLKENNLIELAIAGKLPPHVLSAAKTAAIAEFSSQGGDVLTCSPEEHDEAERELDAYLAHYRLDKALRGAARAYKPRTFKKGSKYTVRRGYFEGRVVTYKGTDREVWGAEWLDSPGNPACERYIFRAQHDKLSVSLPALVFLLNGEARDIILQEHEIGMEVV